MVLETVTIVIPLYNEEATLDLLFAAVSEVTATLPKIDVIFVDDGSTDSTAEKLTNAPFPATILSLSRNFGHQAALLAGLEAAKGDIIITMDGDLQHPLSLIPKMLEAHKNGVDIVLTQRIDEDSISLAKKETASLFYRLLNAISSQKILPNGSDFRSMNRKALDALLQMPEKRKFLRGMVQWVGFTQIILPFQTQQRQNGESKYTWFKMLQLALFGITSFSTAPLYFSAFFGFGLFAAAFLYALYVIYIKLFSAAAVEGWASVLFVLLLVGGFLSLFLGLIGLYIAAIYDEVKNRPNYIVANTTAVKLSHATK
jgi:polyisoprenyl-phosphate glycosyltransferase